jgi:hypothetical protein
VPGPVKVRLCFHNHCFDGAASSAVFMRFYQSRIQPNSEFHFTGMMHRASTLFDAGTFDGDENAIVDFKYSSSPLVTWWFDHHQSAFLTLADAENFRHDTSGKKFYDPDYKSCTKLIADIAAKKFGFDASPLAELIHWGDIIDGAQYPTPESAVEMREPATQLALVIEAAPDPDLPARLIPEMAVKPLAEIVRLPMVAKHLGPLLERHKWSIEILRERSDFRGGVIFYDVSDLDFEGINKFIPYLLHPDAIYTVGVSASPSRTKISLGSNPWNPRAVEKNLATLAETYGGGGHPRVAAISLDTGELERARQIARDIAAQLRD